MSTGQDNTVRLWEVVTGNERLCLKGGEDDELCWHGDISPDGKMLMTEGRWDKPQCLWDPASGKVVAKFKRTGDSFSPCGKVLATADGPPSCSAMSRR